MERLECVEGEPLDVDPVTAELLRRRLAELQTEMRPRLPFLSATAGKTTVTNLVGTVQISADLVIDIRPKTAPGQDWARSLIDLIETEPISLGGETRDAEWTGRTVLPDAFARIYAAQLTAATRREGPLTLLVTKSESRSVLAGRLNVSRWVTSRITKPHRFPQTRTVLSADNRYTRAMAWVAEALASRTLDPRLRRRLLSAARDLRPGYPEHTFVEPGVALSDIPSQWRTYSPAWATAQAVLRQISPLHRSGQLHGLGLAVEPWPLLERLLTRSLQSAAHQARETGLSMCSPSKQISAPLVNPIYGETVSRLSRIHVKRRVKPDGVLFSDDSVVATLEAKYSYPQSADDIRGHMFQALTTAGALDSPLSILVYPELSEPMVWDVEGFGGRPAKLIALGLDMYGYKLGGDRLRGAELLKLVSDHSSVQALPDQV